MDKNKCVNCKTGKNSENEKEIEKNVKKFKKVVDILKHCWYNNECRWAREIKTQSWQAKNWDDFGSYRDLNSHTERYRSGHNEAVLKTVCPKGRVGSNPTLSGWGRTICSAFLLFCLVFWGSKKVKWKKVRFTFEITSFYKGLWNKSLKEIGPFVHAKGPIFVVKLTCDENFTQ